MGLLTFIKDAGEKLFGTGEAKAAQAAAKQTPSPVNVDAANRAAADAIVTYVKSQNLSTTGVTIAFDGASGTVTASGVAPDQETKEKIVLCCGNVEGVEKVDDQMSVQTPKAEARFYTVVKGDNLSKISKQQYGDANKYMKIFEANKPMLTHPDKIYPGQMLRIPPLEG